MDMIKRHWMHALMSLNEKGVKKPDFLLMPDFKYNKCCSCEDSLFSHITMEISYLLFNVFK